MKRIDSIGINGYYSGVDPRIKKKLDEVIEAVNTITEEVNRLKDLQEDDNYRLESNTEIEGAVMKEPSIDGLLDELRGKPVTEEGGRILEWAERRLKPAVRALIQSERRKAAIEILLRIRDKTDFMRGAGMELNIESTIWNELEVLDPSLNDERMAELEGEEI